MAFNPPSARFDAGDPRPIGFQDSPSVEHIDRASDALAALVSDIESKDGTPAGSEELRVCLCSVLFVPGTPFQLYGIHVVGIDDRGEFIEAWEEGHEVRYALIVNHPAELQVESTLAFLLSLLERRRMVSHAHEAGDVSQVDHLAEEADAFARREFFELSRFGWREAAAGVVRKATEIGVKISLRYQRDPFPNREELARRMPLLRTTYNEIDTVRCAVDNTVSAIGGSYPHVRFGGGPSRARDDLQARLAVLGMRQFQNQTTRDAQVCGNGYLVISQELDNAPRCLRPEMVEIDAGGNYFEVCDGPRRPLQDVLHLRGIDQIDCPYGIPVLEAGLSALGQIRTFNKVRSECEPILANPNAPGNQREWAKNNVALVERALAAIEENLSTLYGFTRDSLPEAKPDLYFHGQRELH